MPAKKTDTEATPKKTAKKASTPTVATESKAAKAAAPKAPKSKGAAAKDVAPEVAASAVGAPRPQASHDEVARRAYEIWLARGGSAFENWVEAVRQLNGE